MPTALHDDLACRNPWILPESERDEVTTLARWLQENKPSILVGPDGTSVSIPGSVQELLRHIVKIFVQGNAVLIEPVRMEVSCRQAADLLNVSHEYLTNLINIGVVRCTETNGRRRLQLGDIVALKGLRSRERKEGLRRLSEISQEADEQGRGRRTGTGR